MTRDGDEVFGLEIVGLVENATADFGQCKAVSSTVVVDEASCLLNGLEGDAAHTWLFQGVLDDGAKFVVVDAAFHCDD